MHDRSELDQYFMFDLADSVSCVAEPVVKAYVIIATLACGGDLITESLLSLYIMNLQQVDSYLLMNMVAWFAGMEYLNVDCDCGPDKTLCMLNGIWGNDAFYDGRAARADHSENYLAIGVEIEDLKDKLYT